MLVFNYSSTFISMILSRKSSLSYSNDVDEDSSETSALFSIEID